jgi:hypothetical protein
MRRAGGGEREGEEMGKGFCCGVIILQQNSKRKKGGGVHLL